MLKMVGKPRQHQGNETESFGIVKNTRAEK